MMLAYPKMHCDHDVSNPRPLTLSSHESKTADQESTTWVCNLFWETKNLVINPGNVEVIEGDPKVY